MKNINILDPNLGQSHPQLVPWVNGMRQAGYSGEQIQMYFREQMRQQMAQEQARTMQQQQQQMHQQAQTYQERHVQATIHHQQQQTIPNLNAQQRQAKAQMARNIVQAYTGRISLQQVMEMSFERVQGLHNEIISRLNQNGQHQQQQSNQRNQINPQQQPTKFQMAQFIVNAHQGVSIQNVMAMTNEKVCGWYNEAYAQFNNRTNDPPPNHEQQQQEIDTSNNSNNASFERSNSHQNMPCIPPQINESKNNDQESSSNNKKKKRLRLEVREWLNQIGLESSEIFDILINNGCESLQVIRLIDVNDLNAMKIRRIGWKKALLNGIDALNKNENKNKKRKIEQIKDENDDIELLEPVRKKMKIDNDKSKESDSQNIASQRQVHEFLSEVKVDNIDKSEDTEDDDDNNIEFNINRPPPKTNKKLKIKMRKNQQFGSAFGRLETKFGQKITLSFDGMKINNEWTPQKLINEFDFEEGDLIDAKYE